MQVTEEVVSPGDQGQLVNLVDAFSTFLTLTSDPVPAKETLN
jgi:hypothetical protein